MFSIHAATGCPSIVFYAPRCPLSPAFFDVLGKTNVSLSGRRKRGLGRVPEARLTRKFPVERCHDRTGDSWRDDWNRASTRGLVEEG